MLLPPRFNRKVLRLPLKLIATIAEFLIGDFAFGTAANLNVTSQAVREETLPVLYETLCLDRMNADVYLLREESNPGFKYTKYVAFRDSWRKG